VEGLRIVYFMRLFLDQILLVIEIFLVLVGMGIIYALLVAGMRPPRPSQARPRLRTPSRLSRPPSPCAPLVLRPSLPARPDAADVDAKVYECGMLRALGMAQFTLVELLTVQSLFFALPGTALGLVAAWALFLPVATFFTSYTA